VKVKLTHPEKVLFPADGYTKADMVSYYLSVADRMLPLMRSHPLAMLRFNNGIDGERFFHKQAPNYFPDFIERVEVPKSKGTTKYPVCNNSDALAYIANHNCVEFHLLGVRADDLWHPDRMVFDLDPSIDDFGQVRDAARWLHDLLDEIGLASFLMTSGSRGLHIWVPLDRRSTTEEVVSFAAEVAKVLADGHPDVLTTEFSKADREDRIYLDTARNAPSQHAVAPYSLRAKDGAPVATPISWDELDAPDLHPQRWTIRTVKERLETDPWKGMMRRAKSLARAAKALERLAAA
jgi:bifunctional non-homologous end joining protein LigD